MPAPHCSAARTVSGVSALAVDGGSSGGRAPKAAWMTSTMPGASAADATDTTRSETEMFTTGNRIGARAAERRLQS